MFIQFFIDLYNKICNWFVNLLKKKDPLVNNAEHFSYDDVYIHSLEK